MQNVGFFLLMEGAEGLSIDQSGSVSEFELKNGANDVVLRKKTLVAVCSLLYGGSALSVFFCYYRDSKQAQSQKRIGFDSLGITVFSRS